MKKFVLQFLFTFFASVSAYSQAGCPQAATGNYWREVVSSNSNHAAIKTDGTLWVWGSNIFNQVTNVGSSSTIYDIPVQVGTSNDWAQVSVGYECVYAIKTNGSLWVWGNNDKGRLGTGNTNPISIPTQLQPGTIWKWINAGQEHVVGIKSDGSLWAWGGNTYGQLGTGNTTNSFVPVRIGTGTTWNTVSAGLMHNLAIQTNGTLWAWGSNSGYQIGDGTALNRFTPVQIGTATNWKKVVAKSYVSVGVRTDGSLWGWGSTGVYYGAGNSSNSVPLRINPNQYWLDVYHGSNVMIAVESSGVSYMAGQSFQFQNLKMDQFRYDTLTPLTVRFQKYSLSSFAVLGIDSTGSVFGWGGLRGSNDSTVTRVVTRLTTANRELSVCKGSALTVGAVPSGLAGVTYAWTAFPAGTTSVLAQPSFTFTRPGMVVVSAAKTGCATTYDTAYVHLRAAPETVTLPKWKESFQGQNFTMAITNNGELWGWGANHEYFSYLTPSGVMGHTNYTFDTLPIRIHASINWKSISIFPTNYVVLALSNDGYVYQWGYGLGKSPILLSNTKFKTISQGWDHSLLIDENGELWSFGNNSLGQCGVGNNNATSALQKIPMNGRKFISVAAGTYASCAVAQDGTMWSWGQNVSGELGIGTTANQNKPTRVGSANNWVMVAFKPMNTYNFGSFLGLNSIGAVYHWGKKQVSGVYQNFLSPTLVSTSNIFQLVLPQGYLFTNANQLYFFRDDAFFSWTSYGYHYSKNLSNTTFIDTAGRMYSSGTPQFLGVSFQDSRDQFETFQIKTYGGVKEICPNTIISIGQNSPVSNRTYSWSSVPAGITGTMYPTSYNFSTNSKVMLTVTDAVTGCTFKDSIWIQLSTPTQHAGTNVTRCEGYELILGGNAIPGHYYEWSSLPVLEKSISGKIKIITKEGITQYLVKDSLIGGGSCSTYDTVTVTSSPVPYSAPYPFWRSVSTGSNFSHGIRSDGTLWAWGGNNGSLGDGTTTNRNAPVQIGTSRIWKTIKAGALFTIGLQTDGSLWSWGNGNNGVLGRGAVTSSTSPVRIGTGTWKTFSCGFQFVMAIASDGSLWGWGYNSTGQLGIGNTTTQNTPVRIGTANDWREVAAGENFTVAVKNDGTLWTWGSNANKQLANSSIPVLSNVPVQVGTAKDWVKVAAGWETAFAFKMDSTLWAWGLDGSEGMTGTGAGSSAPYQVLNPTQIPGKWLSVYCSGYGRFSHGIKADSTLWAWGSNLNYGYGDPVLTSSKTPIRISTKKYSLVSNNYSHVLLMDVNNALFSWGQNGWGQLGVGTTIDHYTPKQINNWGREIEICSGTTLNLGFPAQTGLTYSWYSYYGFTLSNNAIANPTITPISSSYQRIGFQVNTYTSGSNNCGSSSELFGYVKGKVTPASSSICEGASVVLTAESPIVLSNSNSIKSWSSNPTEIIKLYNGQSSPIGQVEVFPKGTTRYYYTDSTIVPFGCLLKDSCLITVNAKPEAVATVYWKKVVSGNGFSIGLKSDGSLFSWGGNASGQLGLGTTTSTIPTPTRIGTSTNWADVSAGDNHVLAIQKDGTLWAWGNNTSGKLGDGTTVNRLAPVQIGTAANWKAVSAGFSHSMGIQTNGFLFGWGNNGSGQLGTGNINSVSVPTLVGTANNWIAVEAGEFTTVGIRSGFQNWCGSLWVWGLQGSQGYTVPTQIGTETNWWKISCRGAGKAALKSDGSLYSWGSSINNTFYTQTTPVLRSSEKWINVVAGQRNLHAQKENGSIWGVGGNAGTLGDGTTNAASNLVQISFSGVNISQFDHNYHFAGVDRNGAFWTISTNVTGESGVSNFVPLVPNRSTAEKDIKTCSSQFSLGQTAVAGNTYQWANPSNTNLSTSAVFSATPNNYVTSYFLRVTNAAGCIKRDTITMEGGKTQINKPNGLAKACYGQNNTLNSVFSFNNHRYSWSTNRSAADTANNSSSFSISNVTNSLAVYLTDSFPAGQCTSRDTVNLSIFKPTVAAKYHYIQTSSTNSHGLAVRNDGTLWAWGVNTYGQIGDGTTTTRTMPVQVGTANDWVFVAAGKLASYAIKSDGSLWSWGENVNGALGRTGTTNVPGQIGSEKNWKFVNAGYQSAFAIKNDGTLWAWGYNLDGQLGIGNTTNQSSPVQVGTQKDWARVDISFYHVLALKTDSSLWVWGANSFGNLGIGSGFPQQQTTPLLKPGKWIDIAAGSSASFAIKSDRTLWAWGADGGILGTGSTSVSHQLNPIQIGTKNNWKQISTSSIDQIGIQMDSSLWVWGRNGNYSHGTGTNLQNFVPTQIREEEKWISAQHAGSQSYATNSQRSIFVSGNGYRNLRVHSRVDSTSNDVVFCALNSVNLGYAATPTNTTYYWQSNPNGLGNPNTSIFTYFPNSPATWWVAATDSNGCVARDTVYVNAQKTSTNLGADRSNCRANALSIGNAGINGETFSWTSIPAGFTSTSAMATVTPLVNTQYIRAVTNSCGTTRDTLLVSINVPNAGTDRTVCRGSNAQVPFSKLAKHGYTWAANRGFERTVSNDTLTVKKVEATVQLIMDDYDSTAFCFSKDTLNLTVINSPLAVPAFYWVDVASGFAHTLAVRSDGTLWAWGRGTEGQLGDGASLNRSQPVQVGTATDWEKVYAYNNSSFATKTNGELYAWGNNNQYILGTGDLLGKTTPTLTNSSGGWKKIHCSTHCMAVKNDGSLWAWGQNSYGELFTRNTTPLTVPTAITEFSNLEDAQAAVGYSIVLKKDSTLLGAGYNYSAYQILGVTPGAIVNPVVLASSMKFKSFATGKESISAVASNGTLWSWGSNNYGQLGTNVSQAFSPIQIGTSNLWSEITGDGYCIYAKRTDKGVWAWGFNLQGQLGIGNKLNQNAPALLDSSVLNYKIVPAGDHTIALSPNGQLFVIGANSSNVFTSTMGPVSYERPAIIPSNGKEIFPCVGTNWTLGKAAITGETYQWFYDSLGCINCNFSTVANPIRNVSQRQSYGLRVTAANGCTDTKYTTLTPKFAPQISLGQNQSVCQGTSVSLGTTPDTSTTFTWSSVPAGLSSSLSSVTVTPTQTTQYSLLAVNRCGTQNTSVTLTYDPLKTPAVSFQTTPDTVTSDQSISFFTNNQNGGTSPVWQWYRNGQLVVQTGVGTQSFTQWKDYDTIQVVLNSNATCKTKSADTAQKIIRMLNIRNIPGDFQTSTICTPILPSIENMVRDSLKNLVYSVVSPPAALNQVCWGVRQFGGPTVRKSLWNNGQQLTYWLDRNFFIEPNQQPGTTVTVKFYFYSTELNEIIDSVSQQTGQVFTRDSIRLFKFSTPNLDLDPLNNGNSDAVFQILSPRIFPWNINPKFTVLEFQINSFSEFSFGIKATNPNPLPIETLRWKVEKKGSDAFVQWIQPYEEQLDAYEIEFSTNGKDFQSIHRVSAGQQNYHFLQSNAADLGKTGYYRITEINLDGSRASSNVQRLMWNNTLQFGPNPVITKGNIASSKSLRSSWELTDAQGRIIRSGTWNGKELEMDFQGLAAGIYFIRTEGEVLKWVKE